MNLYTNKSFKEYSWQILKVLECLWHLFYNTVLNSTMLRLTLRSWANLLLIPVVFLPIMVGAKAFKKEAIDISIIEQSDTLIPYMTTGREYNFSS